MDNYLGEIRPFAFGFAPTGWHLCDGSSLPINQNQALYALIGLTYGGTSTSFNLPDLRGRTPVCATNGGPSQTPYGLGSKGGAETVTIAANNMPTHTHLMQVANAPGNAGINTNRLAIPTSVTPAATANIYTTDISLKTNLAINTLDNTGGNIPHENLQPFLAVNYCIAMSGLWPSRP